MSVTKKNCRVFFDKRLVFEKNQWRAGTFFFEHLFCVRGIELKVNIQDDEAALKARDRYKFKLWIGGIPFHQLPRSQAELISRIPKILLKKPKPKPKPKPEPPSPEAIKKIQEMGFSDVAAKIALDAVNNKVEAACALARAPRASPARSPARSVPRPCPPPVCRCRRWPLARSPPLQAVSEDPWPPAHCPAPSPPEPPVRHLSCRAPRSRPPSGGGVVAGKRLQSGPSFTLM